MHYYFGIDGGGSGCRAVLSDGNGAILGKGMSGPANIGADTANAILHIREAAEQARLQADLPPSIYITSVALLGLAGANSLTDQGALGNGDGAIAILGTGSAFVKRTGDTVDVIGGRGFMLSDHAGGARLGRDLLEQTLLVSDGINDETELTRKTLDKFDDEARRITQFSRTATAADYAAFAPMVFEFAAKGDTLGMKLVSDACIMIERNLRTLDIKALGRFSITGGLAASYAALDLLPYKEFYTPAKGDSLQGALALALQNYRDQATATRK
jgi:glucosamine kinase